MLGTIDWTIIRPNDTAGIRYRRAGLYYGPAAYVAGGDPIAGGDLKLGEIEDIHFNTAIDQGLSASYHLVFDKTNGKVIWLIAGGTEVVAGTNLSTFFAGFEAFGKG